LSKDEDTISAKFNKGKNMRRAFNIVMRIVSSLIGLLMVAGGSFWALQGLRLTGPNDKSFMVGDQHWILYGAIFALLGLGQVVWSITRQN
jgi:hypothetical protein